MRGTEVRSGTAEGERDSEETQQRNKALLSECGTESRLFREAEGGGENRAFPEGKQL